MSGPLVLVTGFGAFEAFATNPSAEVARALATEPPLGMRVAAAVLPVSFARAPEELDAFLRSSGAPALLLSLGVASRGERFRLERRASPALRPVPRPDVDGRSALEFSRAGPARDTEVDLERLLGALRDRGVGERELTISDTAGGYVCEHLYHHLLGRAREHGVPALFLHVPAEVHAPLGRQVEVARWVLEELVNGQAGSRSG